jgi:hypothetical protein
MESKNYNFVSAAVSSCKKNYDEPGNNKYFLNVYLGMGGLIKFRQLS